MGKYKLTTEQYNKLIEFSVKRERVDEGIGDLIGSALGLGWKASKAMWNASGANQVGWIEKINNAVDRVTKSENERVNLKNLKEYKKLVEPVIKGLEDFRKTYIEKLNSEKEAYNKFIEQISEAYDDMEDTVWINNFLPDETIEEGDRGNIDIWVKDYFGKRKKLGVLSYFGDEADPAKNIEAGVSYNFTSDKYLFSNNIKENNGIKVLSTKDNKLAFNLLPFNVTPKIIFDNIINILYSNPYRSQTLNWFYSFNRISLIYAEKAKNIFVEFDNKVNEFMRVFDNNTAKNESYNKGFINEGEGIFDRFKREYKEMTKGSGYVMLNKNIKEITEDIDNIFTVYESSIRKKVYDIVTPFRGKIKELDKAIKDYDRRNVDDDLARELLRRRLDQNNSNRNKRK